MQNKEGKHMSKEQYNKEMNNVLKLIEKNEFDKSNLDFKKKLIENKSIKAHNDLTSNESENYCKLDIDDVKEAASNMNRSFGVNDNSMYAQKVAEQMLSKNHKFLELTVKDASLGNIYILRDEFNNILSNDHKITEDEVNQAIDIIASFFMQNGICRMASDLTNRNILAGPVLKLTMEQIEEKYGCQVEIIR